MVIMVMNVLHGAIDSADDLLVLRFLVEGIVISLEGHRLGRSVDATIDGRRPLEIRVATRPGVSRVETRIDWSRPRVESAGVESARVNWARVETTRVAVVGGHWTLEGFVGVGVAHWNSRDGLADRLDGNWLCVENIVGLNGSLSLKVATLSRKTTFDYKFIQALVAK